MKHKGQNGTDLWVIKVQMVWTLLSSAKKTAVVREVFFLCKHCTQTQRAFGGCSVLALFCYDWKKIKFGEIIIYLPKKAGLALPNLFTKFGKSEYNRRRWNNRHIFAAWETLSFCYFCYFFSYCPVQHGISCTIVTWEQITIYWLHGW